MRNEAIYGMSKSEAIEFLRRASVIHFASINHAGLPVLRTVHGVIVDDHIAFHGSPVGEKVECESRPVVLSAEEIVTEIPSYFIDPIKACPATTYYRSVQVRGELTPIHDLDERAKVLQALMEKFQPEGGHQEITAEDPMYKGAVKNLMLVKVSLHQIDGKAKLGQNRKPEELREVLHRLWQRGSPQDLRAIELVRRANPNVPAPDVLCAPAGLRFCVDPTQKDAEEVATLLQGTYWNTHVSREQLIRAHLSSSAWICLHNEEGRVVASARAISDRSKWAIMYDVIVSPSLQRGGVGQWMIKLLLDHPAVRGVIGVRLGTRDAQTFYQKFGFVDVKERPLRSYPTSEMLLLR
jgi:nitroimidazol reductase NimA-like FMN-containing flavoprotein (pyridoxamine 5'-phosphate oxidase superfamily)/N-acetylglutamate synthase-like GNAT family acetyltransferase